VKDTIQRHLDFIASSAHKEFLALLSKLTPEKPIIRHANVKEYSPKCRSLGKGAPVTGTAIYLATDENWDAAYEHWSTIVCHVPGFMGIAGKCFPHSQSNILSSNTLL